MKTWKPLLVDSETYYKVVELKKKLGMESYGKVIQHLINKGGA